MIKSKPGIGKRQDRNFEIVVNHITINEDQLPQVSWQSILALKNVFGHNIKKYSGTLHHKPGNQHVHFLVMSEAPKTKSAVSSIAASMALIFGTKTASVEVKFFNGLKAVAGPAHGLKGLGEDDVMRMITLAVSQEWFWTKRASASGNSGHQGRDSRVEVQDV